MIWISLVLNLKMETDKKKKKKKEMEETTEKRQRIQGKQNEVIWFKGCFVER